MGFHRGQGSSIGRVIQPFTWATFGAGVCQEANACETEEVPDQSRTQDQTRPSQQSQPRVQHAIEYHQRRKNERDWLGSRRERFWLGLGEGQLAGELEMGRFLLLARRWNYRCFREDRCRGGQQRLNRLRFGD